MLITAYLRLVTVVAAVVGALATALISAGLLIGIAWLFLFGDDPWPRWYWTAQYLAAVGVGLYAGWWIARSLWRRLSAAQARSPATALAQATLVLGVSALVILWLMLESA